MASAVPMTVTVRVTAKLPMVWRHHCGRLNDSPWPTVERASVCAGCRSDVRLDEVEARFILVEPVAS